MKNLKTLFRTLFFLGIGILLLWLTFRNQDFSEVWAKMATASPFYILLCIICSVAALISRSMRWVQLIEPMGHRPRLSSTYHALMFGYLANMALPRLGEISRCGALSKSDEVPFEKLVGTVIVERLLDVIMLALSILFTATLEYKRLGGFLYTTILEPILKKMAAGPLLIAIVLVVLAAGVVVLIGLFRMSDPPAFIQKIRSLATGVGEGLRSIIKVKNKGLFIFHTVFIWAMYYCMSYFCFLALAETEMLGASAALFIMVLGGIGMSAPVQGGIGVYHTLVAKGMLLYGLTETDGIVYATLSHTVSTLVLILLGALSMLSLFFFVKTKSSRIA